MPHLERAARQVEGSGFENPVAFMGALCIAGGEQGRKGRQARTACLAAR